MTTRATKRVEAALGAMGLTELEAAVYAFLCAESPATGYRAAQGVGRPIGAVYKAVEGLEEKGAVFTAEQDGVKLLRAVPIAEFAARVRRGVEEAAARAQGELASGEPGAGDDALWRLEDATQTLQRAVAMVEGATGFVLAIVTPALTRAVLPLLAAASTRGVAVGVKVFQPIDDEFGRAGMDVVVDERGLAAVEAGPGSWLVLNIDGEFYLQALFDEEGKVLRTGHWSANALLAWATFTGLSSNVLLTMVRGRLAAGAAGHTVARELESFAAFERPKSAGKLKLSERFRRASPRARRRGEA